MTDETIRINHANFSQYYPNAAIKFNCMFAGTSATIEPKYMQSDKQFRCIRYCTPEDILDLFAKRKAGAKFSKSYERNLPKWEKMIKRSKQILDEI